MDQEDAVRFADAPHWAKDISRECSRTLGRDLVESYRLQRREKQARRRAQA